MNRYPFLEAIGNADEKFLEEVFEDKEQERRRISMSKKKLVTIIAAAAAVVVLTIGAAATTVYTGLVGEESAFGSATTYVVKHADSEDEKNNLANFILAGLTYDKSSETQEVSFGLSGFRPVYNVKFKVGGFAYTVKVDAKTGVAISCDREIDEGWKEHLENEAHSGNTSDPSEKLYSGIEIVAPTPGVEYDMGNISVGDVFLIGQTYFGLDVTQGDNCWRVYSAQSFANYAASTISFVVQEKHAGYVYECSIDSATGEVTELFVGEDPEYDGDDVHRHTRSDEYIGSYQATIIAREEMGLAPDKALSPFFDAKFYGFEPFVVGESPSYEVYMFYYNDGQNINRLAINAKTGEVVEKGAEPADNGASKRIQVPSAEAPDGMISEADAQVIVLDDLGITDRDIKGFTIELKEAYYEINITVADSSYIYKVDAVSGRISDKSER